MAISLEPRPGVRGGYQQKPGSEGLDKQVGRYLQQTCAEVHATLEWAAEGSLKGRLECLGDSEKARYFMGVFKWLPAELQLEISTQVARNTFQPMFDRIPREPSYKPVEGSITHGRDLFLFLTGKFKYRARQRVGEKVRSGTFLAPTSQEIMLYSKVFGKGLELP